MQIARHGAIELAYETSGARAASRCCSSAAPACRC